ncbi:MICOS complex subunit MIC27 [Scomber scombrus]|uniref:MICOS complex subunit MIC27 n=1 Tax=Scomber scombrus TaxID=13677 RepID=UPI002DDA0265|nr:MICOS complex subunit MIC27 [Scomber scombrus]
MAAKVVMVAVPTVLGIASIRVYTVKEVSADGLVTREKLNIYNPLPPSTQVHFVPDSPGVIESGLTTARENILPFVHAVKGACVSVKRGSVNLYHAGEDLYFYLKDPPPGFLPRFGTITMAGLLGMFLARKGSRFKKLALPLGLMSAGASVCYPAQAVAVCKVTGKKVYAAGQWSSATVSSLLTYVSQEPVAKEIAASKPQAATVPNPESAVVEEAQSAACHASEPSSTTDDSAQSTVLSDEPIVNGTEEGSSVTLTEISPDQPPTETNTDLVVQSVPAETTPPSELPAPVESEEPPALKPASEEVSTEASAAEPTPSLEPETVDPAPVEPAPAESAPVESAPAESAPVESAPAEPAPVESAPAEPAPVESAPAEPAPVESAPVEAAPVEPAPVEPAPVEPAPVEPAPAEAAPSTEEPPAPNTSEEPAAVAVVESADLESASEPQLVAAVEEAPTHTPPPPEQPAADNNKGGSGFKPDPALMDFGQSNPEDEDLYSTRS